MIQQPNKRRSARAPVRAQVEVRLSSGVLLEGETRDIGLHGLWFATDRSLPIGNNTRVCMVLDTSHGEVRIDMHGSVVRDDEGGVAIQFTEVSDDSAAYLEEAVAAETKPAAYARNQR